jgi:RimJ/RimL family protein N-acetyltransferase
MAPPILETERLILCPVELADFEPWAQMMADEETARFIGGVQPKPVAWRGFMSMAGAWALTGIAMFSVIEKASGAWIGRLGPWRPYGWVGNEVGWGLVRDSWGRGYATEGASAAMDYAFDVLHWPDAIHCIEPGNAASRRVAQRLGSRLRRHARLPPPYEAMEVEVWGQTRQEWLARRSGR